MQPTTDRKALSWAERVFEHPPLGRVRLQGDQDRGLQAIEIEPLGRSVSISGSSETLSSSDPLLYETEARLKAYLSGQPVSFHDIPLAPAGTPFQSAVWSILQTIPYGQTRSYKWVAERLGRPLASRAVGQANGRNPIPLIIPCHRVIQHDQSLGGYSCGLDVKRFLLQLESTVMQSSHRVPPTEDAERMAFAHDE